MFPTLSFGDQEFTPQEMSARSAQVAGAMAAVGLKEGDTIALMLRNEPALIDVMLAARQLGLYFTPLNWHFKSEEAAYIVRDCGAKALFTHTDLFQQIADGIPPDIPVFSLRPHPLTIASYNIVEPATRIPDGTSDWATVVANAVLHDKRDDPARDDRLHIWDDWKAEGGPSPCAFPGPSSRARRTNGADVPAWIGHYARCALPDFRAALPQRAMRIFSHSSAIWRVAAARAEV